MQPRDSCWCKKHVTLHTLLPHNNNTNLNALNLIIATNAHILPQDDSWRDGWFIRGGETLYIVAVRCWITRRPVAENLLLLSPAELTSRSSFHRPARGLFLWGLCSECGRSLLKVQMWQLYLCLPSRKIPHLDALTQFYIFILCSVLSRRFFIFFLIKRGNLIWSSFMSGIVSLHEPRRLCNNPERTSVILHLHKAVGVLVISESEMQFEKKVRQSTCSVVRVHLSTHLCKTLNGTQW